MAGTIKTISDKAQFKEIFDKFFLRRDVFIKTKSGDMSIQFLGYADGNVAFKIPRVKSLPDSIVVLTRLGDNTIYASLKLLVRNEDTFTFIPIQFQVIMEKRREERTDLPEAGGKNVLFVTNLMSESMIQNILDLNEKKLGILKDNIKRDLKGKFDRTKIVLLNETRIDVRMKRFQDAWTPIFIRDITAAEANRGDRELSSYMSEIYAKDYKLAGQKELISEITLPLIYRNIIPYGYIQVNNVKPMNDTHLTSIKRLAAMINEYFVKEKIFEPAKERFIVNDVSMKGIGIVFRDRRLLRYFAKDSRVIIELMLPDDNRVTMVVVVRNTIFHDSGIIKVGMEIATIDAISEVNYEEYLQTMKQ
ncbi:MAG: hypothetical protein JW807_00380 [Spirochaetes bacterium]|nr:hypothetical protein [Spirochaetota bacterium]